MRTLFALLEKLAVDSCDLCHHVQPEAISMDRLGVLTEQTTT